MVDKNIDTNPEIGYNDSAEVNKAIACRGFFISSSTHRPFCQPHIFGAKVPVITFARRESPTCRFLASATESNVVTGLFSFLTKWTGRKDACDTFTPLTNANTEVAMAHQNIPLSIDSHKPESFNLELSADIDEARYNVELFKDRILEDGQALLFWQNRLKTLENQVPQIQNHLISQLKSMLANLE